MYKLSMSTRSTTFVATRLSMGGHCTTPATIFFPHNDLCYHPSAHLTSDPPTGPAEPGTVTAWRQLMLRSVRPMRSILYRSKTYFYHASNPRQSNTIQHPRDILFTVSFHVRHFFNCKQPPQGPKNPLDRVSTSWGGPKVEKLSRDCDTQNTGTLPGLASTKWSSCWSHHSLPVKLVLFCFHAVNDTASKLLRLPCFQRLHSPTPPILSTYCIRSCVVGLTSTDCSSWSHHCLAKFLSPQLALLSTFISSNLGATNWPCRSRHCLAAKNQSVAPMQSMSYRSKN